MDFSADTALLSTKLKIPAPRKNYIVRRALFEELSHCADVSVVFVQGGPGTGKTTLLSSFLRETGLANVCWMTVDSSSANVYSFWLYFTAAVSAFFDDGESFLSLMRANPDASHTERLLTLLINRLCGEDDYYMVLDDVHCIRDEALVRTFEFFISAMPENFHFFLLSREEAPVYLGPLAVAGRLTYIDGKQMQLTPQEGMTFLKDTLHLGSSDEELCKLNAYAEGWIGGLQLAAAAGATEKRFSRLLRAGGGIASEYLTREVIESLTPPEREFLLKTGFLSYFDAEICARLFPGFTKAEFDLLIERLFQKNLFVICIDEERGIYRYHNILSEYLTEQFRRLPEEARKALHCKAALAYEQCSDFEEALREFCEAEAYEEVLRVAQAMGGKIEAWSYLNRVPVQLLITNADLAAQCLMYNLGNLNMDRCRILYEQFREHYEGSDIFRVLQFAESFVAQGSNILPHYHVLTPEQIDHLHLGPVAKAIILVENSAALIEHMQYEEAESCIKSVLQTCSDVNVFVDFFAYDQLAQVYEEMGRLNDSLSCYSRAKELIKSPSMMSGIGANYYFGLTGVYIRQMELTKAEEILRQAETLLEAQHLHSDVTDMTLSYHLAEMKFLSGEDDAGEAYVGGILSEYPSFSVLTLGRLLWELDCGNKLSSSMAEQFLTELEAAGSYRSQPFMRLLRARLLFKQGEKEEALRETDDILTFSRLHKNQLRLVEAGLLKVWMLQSASQTGSGQREMDNLLREALHYACEDRILMPFFLDRSVLLPLLRSLSERLTGKNAMAPKEVAFLREAMAVCGHVSPAVREPELLSARELEVLFELSLGITNREIADKLCISQATVKTHVLSIFGKLGVSSRLMAVKEGREKGLLR